MSKNGRRARWVHYQETNLAMVFNLWRCVDAILRTFARIGLLYLNNGILNGEQIIPKDWINDCLTVHRMDDDSGAGYEYYFWNFQLVKNQ